MEPDFETALAVCEGADPARVVVKTVVLRAEADVRRALIECGGDGWVCGRSETPSRWRGRLPASTILSAEVVNADGQSVHVRYSGDRWLVTTIAETDRDDAATECVAFDEAVLSSLDRPKGRPRPRLTYRTYWKTVEVDGVPVWRPWVSRFTGWQGIEEKA